MSIGYLPTLGKDFGGIGFYHSELVHVPQWPDKMLVREDQEIADIIETAADSDFPSSEELKMHMSWDTKSNGLTRYAQYYQLYYVEKMPKSTIADKFGVKTRTVDLGIKNYRKTLLYKINPNH